MVLPFRFPVNRLPGGAATRPTVVFPEATRERKKGRSMTRFALAVGWLTLLSTAIPLAAAQLTVEVRAADGSPVPGANVVLSNGRGAATSLQGRAVLEQVSGSLGLRVTCVGYESVARTLELPIQGRESLVIVLQARASELTDLTVTGQSPGGLDLSGERATEVLRAENVSATATDGTARAALGAVNGIDTRPCGLCGSAGVGLQGLDPNYTQVNMDGLALMSGVGALYGLDAVGVGGLSSLAVTRGATTVAEGGGAVAGSVDLRSRRPDGRDTLRVRAFVGDGWRHGLGFTAGRLLLGAPALLNADWSADPRRLDRNGDHLTDTPQLGRLAGQLSLGQSGGGRAWALRATGTREHRFAGDPDWEESDAGSGSVYGRDIRIRRGEVRLNLDRLRGASQWTFASALVLHRQDSWYGPTAFDAVQRLWLAQAQLEQRWSPTGLTKVQLGWQDDLYRDGLPLPTDRHDRVPSLALSQSGVARGLGWEGGLRLEKQEEGWIPLLRGSLAGRPAPDFSLRLSAGQGYRPLTLFSLDKAVHAGFDHVELPQRLKPEHSLSLNLGLQHSRVLAGGRWQGDLSLFAVEFKEKAILRYTEEVGHLRYGNAQRAHSRGLEARADWQGWTGWHLAAAGTWSRVQVKLDEGWRAEELAGAWTGSALLGRRGLGAWPGLGAELRWRITGPQEMPEGRGREHTPIWSVLDLSLDQRSAAWTVGLDVENLLDYVQPDNPLDGAHAGMLDSALIYGPLVGRRARLRLEWAF